MPKIDQGLDAKPVFDWDHEPLGTVLGSEHDPRTRDPTNLIVGLSSDARERLQTDKETLSLPFEYVFGIRRDEVRLNRGVQEIASNLDGATPQGATEEMVELPA